MSHDDNSSAWRPGRRAWGAKVAASAHGAWTQAPAALSDLLGDDLAWVDSSEALCAQVGSDMWFPEHAGEHCREARAVCMQCPLLEACAQYGLEHPEVQGIWGGLSEADRQRIRNSRARTPVKPARHAPAPAAASSTRPCRRKVRYPTKEAGREAQRRMRPDQNHTATHTDLVLCPDCAGWHITAIERGNAA